MAAERKTRDVADILRHLTRQQMAEEIVRLDAVIAGDAANITMGRLPLGVTVVYGAPEPRPPCAVCGSPAEKHGSYPTCASHPYTPPAESKQGAA